MVRFNPNFQIIRVRNSNLPTVKYGNGIFYDTARMLGRKFLKGGKYFLKQYAFPTAVRLGKEMFESGKKLFNQTKPEVERIISDKTQDIINKLVREPKNFNIKETLRDTSDKIKHNVINPTIDRGKEEVNKIIERLISGQGVGIIKNKENK